MPRHTLPTLLPQERLLNPDSIRELFLLSVWDAGLDKFSEFYLESYDDDEIFALIVHGPDKMQDFLPTRFDVSTPEDAEAIHQADVRVRPLVLSAICTSESWRPEPIMDIALNDRQYAALKKGYRPDMDMRYATFHWRGNFYIYRSGYILKRFRFAKQADGLYHMTAAFTSFATKENHILKEVITSGYWETPLVRF